MDHTPLLFGGTKSFTEMARRIVTPKNWEASQMCEKLGITWRGLLTAFLVMRQLVTGWEGFCTTCK